MAWKPIPCTTADRAPLLAMRVTDSRFLSVHPATALWWQQRDKCRACRHHVPVRYSASGAPVNGERCAVATHYGRGGPDMLNCIDARLDGAACGPGAALFRPKATP